VHSAANASSKSCELDPMNAMLVNDIGTYNIVKAANRHGSFVIYISGTVAALQSNSYEKTKFKAEESVRHADAGYAVLRPSVIFGMSPNTTTDKPFNQMLRNIEGKGTPAYDMSWRFQPTWIGHISEIIGSIMDKGIRNEEVPVIVREMKSKFDIASDLLSEFGIKATPSDEKSHRPSSEHSIGGLIRLGLPIHSYAEMKGSIIKELRERDSYVL